MIYKFIIKGARLAKLVTLRFVFDLQIQLRSYVHDEMEQVTKSIYPR